MTRQVVSSWEQLASDVRTGHKKTNHFKRNENIFQIRKNTAKSAFSLFYMHLILFTSVWVMRGDTCWRCA